MTAAGTGTAVHRRGLALSERKLLLAGGDCFAVGAALLIAFNLEAAQARHLGLAVPRIALGIVIAVYLVAAYVVNAYRLAGVVNLRSTFRIVSGSIAISFVGLLGVFFVVPYRITRPTLIIWLPISMVLLLTWRLAYRRVFSGAIFAGSLAVVADPEGFRRLWPDARGAMHGLYRVVEVLNPDRPDCSDMLVELTAEGKVDQVVLGVKGELPESVSQALIDCYDRGVPVRSLSDVYEELTGRMLLDQLGHSWLLSLPMRSETSRLYIAFKRGLDITAGCTGLLVAALVMPFVWIAIKTEDRGPLMFRQERLGKYGRPFVILKVRTMRVGNEDVDEASQTDRRDPRITRLGRFLRRTHLDELPQSWNVIKGEMSVIGPRPEQPAYVAALEESIGFYRTRLSVRPGLTGWAQVNIGYSDGVEGAREKLSYDLYYIKRQSPALDLLIVARTVFAVFSLGGR
jgi:exopolysaccharide biosynthesis polyprenyl glycosylphosphotransferase